jgi:PAS domain S-box-containing protein
VTARESAREAVEASVLRLKALLERVDLLACSLDLDGRVAFSNATFLWTTGWTAGEASGRDWFDTFIPAGSRAAMRAEFLADMAAGAVDRDIVIDLVLRSGAPHRAHLHVMGVHDSSGHLAGITLIGEDLTAIEDRATTAARLTAAVEQSGDAIVITAADASIVYVNPAFERVTGYLRDEVTGRNPRFLQSGVQTRAFYRRMWRALRGGETWSGELVNRRKDGSLFIEEASITPIRDAAGVVTAYVGVKRDVTRLRELRETLDRSAHQHEEVARVIASLESGPTIEVTGERIVAALADIPGIDTAGLLLFENGLGGRFVAMATVRDLPLLVGEPLPTSRIRYLRERAAQGPWAEAWTGRSEDGAYGELVAEAGARAVLYVPIANGSGPFGLISVSTRHDPEAAHLAGLMPTVIEVAVVARTLLGSAVQARALVQDARARVAGIIAAQAFRPVFQPVVELATGHAIGFEALTRFDDGTRPDLTFGAARLAGLGTALEAATLRVSLAAADDLPPGPWVSLNVSPALVLEDGLLEDILRTRTRPVVLEMTEHELIEDYVALRTALERLGPDVRVAVDDAGAGVANFRHLVELRPDVVKMDISLVRDINADVTRQALAVGLLHFARSTGRSIVAEGVETEAERKTLLDLDLRFGQGYLFGQPVEVRALRAFPVAAGGIAAARRARTRRPRASLSPSA